MIILPGAFGQIFIKHRAVGVQVVFVPRKFAQKAIGMQHHRMQAGVFQLGLSVITARAAIGKKHLIAVGPVARLKVELRAQHSNMPLEHHVQKILIRVGIGCSHLLYMIHNALAAPVLVPCRQIKQHHAAIEIGFVGPKAQYCRIVPRHGITHHAQPVAAKVGLKQRLQAACDNGIAVQIQ